MTQSTDRLILHALADNPAWLSTCADWALSTWGASWGHSPSRAKAWLTTLLANEAETMFVAAIAEQAVGMAGIETYDLAARRDLSPWLANVFVAPAFRRRGIATALVAAVENWAWDRGHNRLYLFTPDQMAFYESRGWHLTGQTDRHNGALVSIMQKAAPAL